jgi:YHS domain-containing protein
MFLWVVRLVIALLIWRGLSRFLGGVHQGLQGGPRDNRPRSGQTPPVALARDPICGTYVVPSRALSAGSGSEMRFFCSENCRRAYVSGRAS